MTVQFIEDHTGDIIAQGLKYALASWSLREDRTVCMTTDSGANVVSALRINNWKRLPCFGYRLHIATERSMRDPRIDRAIGVCKKVVRAFYSSWKKKKALVDAQEELKLPMHKLITESPTRWGLRWHMIERFI
ncbi:zinc finger BED domain-containing protein 4-like [Polypterus senegalus]|uniref:zinc finger BED domain-containing protein 4-like n=1 Tax=Polypterus senegalus TaxID=55291 RepID=UPI0019648862|nr:zinc finger BED domain-containing protein 4-like [Polypterus senegalus]